MTTPPGRLSNHDAIVLHFTDTSGTLTGSVNTFAVGRGVTPGATMHTYDVEVYRDYLRLLAYWRGCKSE